MSHNSTQNDLISCNPSYKLIAITNRALCAEDLPTRIFRLCEEGFDHIIVREKDLSLDVYVLLLQAIGRTVPSRFWPRILLHTYTPSEIRARCPELEEFLTTIGGFQLTARQINLRAAQHLTTFDRAHSFIGTSVHNKEETASACSNRMSYVIASHIYPTACKPGLDPHGLEFLNHVARFIDPSSTELWALGGITPERACAVVKSGVQGLCVMSSAMIEEPEMLVHAFRGALERVS